jgi:very-short-patch-repair endonuclease
MGVSEAAFRPRDEGRAGEVDEVLAIGEERPRHGREASEVDEMLPADRAVAALAARQHGVLTTAQLAAAGLGANAVAHRVTHGRLVRLHRGVFRVGPLAAPRGAEMAAVLATGGVLSHHTAANLWGIRPHRGVVHISVAGEARKRRPGVQIHRSHSLNAAVQDGLPLTTPARTIHDLATCLPQHELDRAVEQAQILRLATRDEIAADMPRRGRAALRAALNHEPQLTRSEAERRLLALIRQARLPRPRTNVVVHGYEVDLLWPEQRLIVEVDGYAYHSTRHAFERDRARDAALQAAGYRVVRFTWRQIVHEPHAVVAQLARLLG